MNALLVELKIKQSLEARIMRYYKQAFTKLTIPSRVPFPPGDNTAKAAEKGFTFICRRIGEDSVGTFLFY